jgi:hypothetical protein
MDWQEISGSWVLVPPRPVAIIHFLGGAFVATAPQLTYRRLLERLADEGYVIIATPFINTFDHRDIAQAVLRSFERALYSLESQVLRRRALPIYGMGHSMGCKLHLLIGSLYPVERAGNILISYNNSSAQEAVPLLQQVSQQVSSFLAASPFTSPLLTDMSTALAVEFTPSPTETTALIQESYQVRRNLLVKFRNDTIDQTRSLSNLLVDLFPQMVSTQRLAGTHLTPLGPDVKWQPGAVFTPFDAIAQFVRQEVYRELEQLEATLLQWLDPVRTG